MNPNRLEPVLLLLFCMIVFFTFVLIGCAFLLKSDGQTFQVVSGALTAVLGAFLLRIKPSKTSDEPDPKTKLDGSI